MQVTNHLQIVMLVIATVFESGTEAATSSAVRLCGRKLSEIMSRVCYAYNSPSWDDPKVVEQTGPVRRKRQVNGIADECCNFGCTWDQLTQYCSVIAHEEPPFRTMKEHMIADRSAESSVKVTAVPPPPAVVGSLSHRRDSRRDGRSRRRRCWCRRKRSGHRQRPELTGNMDLIKNAETAAPVFATVSPLLTKQRSWILSDDLSHLILEQPYLAVNM